jgi:hypothetical protein
LILRPVLFSDPTPPMTPSPAPGKKQGKKAPQIEALHQLLRRLAGPGRS